jgi:hypothetical protein
VHGDGKGQVLNFQLQSPHHITRARGEYYVIVDFEGWRYFELIEPDAERFTDYAWPYYGGYHVYRESIQPATVQSLTIWCNHLPPEDSITVDVRPVRALPLLSTRVVNPRLTIEGRPLSSRWRSPAGTTSRFVRPVRSGSTGHPVNCWSSCRWAALCRSLCRATIGSSSPASRPNRRRRGPKSRSVHWAIRSGEVSSLRGLDLDNRFAELRQIPVAMNHVDRDYVAAGSQAARQIDCQRK